MTVESRASLVAFKSARRMSGVSIVYSRGLQTGTLTAIPGDPIIEVEEDEGKVRLFVRDYIILRTEVESIIGVGNRPERGDKIDEVVAGYTRTYEAMELSGEVSRWWDKAGQVLRIHTVEGTKETTTTDSTSTSTSQGV